MKSIMFEEEDDEEDDIICIDPPNLDELVKKGVISSSTAEKVKITHVKITARKICSLLARLFMLEYSTEWA